MLPINDNLYNFVTAHAGQDPVNLKLRLKQSKYDFPLDFAIQQIKCRTQARRKLSEFLKYREFIFPTALSAEQASDQRVASYHAYVTGSGNKILDMTAGLAIDAMTIAKSGNDVTAVELDPLKAEAARHNKSILNIDTLKIETGDCIEFLKIRPDEKFDIIFIDPARRDGDNRRTYALADCTPDVTAYMELIGNHCKKLLIKASPMLDLMEVLREINRISCFHLVLTDGECKELLIEVNFEIDNPINPRIKVCEIDNDNNFNITDLTWNQLGNTTEYSDQEDMREGMYLYDPNPAFHKLNASCYLTENFERLRKIAPNTDLYVSEILHGGFPGRIFKIREVLDKGKFKALKYQQREVSVRNYYVSAEQLRKKLGVAPGDNTKYVFGFKYGIGEKPLLADCDRLFLD